MYKCGIYLSVIIGLFSVGIARSEPKLSPVRAIVVQPKWNVDDFSTPDRFESWMRNQLEQAQTKFVSGYPNLVVLTELNGIGLLLQGSLWSRRSGRFDVAVALTLFQRLPEVAYHSLTDKTSITRSLLLTLAPEVIEQYVGVCSHLAKDFKVWLVCGSAPLPHLVQLGDRIKISGSDVYNQVLMFDPKGQLLATADKVYLTDLEGPDGLDLSKGLLTELRARPTSVGTLGFATSLDAFKPDVIAHLEKQKANVLVQVDANGQSWTGTEQGVSTHRDQPLAWLDSSWRVVQSSPTFLYALNPMVVGNFLDASFDGQSAIVSKAARAPELQGYVMTPPRKGFLALMPWVATGPSDELRSIGQKLSAGSGHTYENHYVTGVLAADLWLPIGPQVLDLQPHEQALDALVRGGFFERPWVGWRYTFVLFWALLTVLGVGLLGRRRFLGGLPLVLLGGLGVVLTLF